MRDEEKMEMELDYDLLSNRPDDLCTESENLKVENAIVDINKRSIGVDSNTKAIFRQPATIGYEIVNIGNHPIEYQMRVYSLGANGVYTFKEEKRVLEPGQNTYLTKRDTALLVGQTKFGFTVSNGYFTGKSLTGEDEDAVERYLESKYFVRGVSEDTVADRKAIQVNDYDDNTKIQERFIEAFGYLMNDKQSKKSLSIGRCAKQSLLLNEALKKLGKIPDDNADNSNVENTENSNTEDKPVKRRINKKLLDV